jgi:hypothetical protein
MLIYVPRYEQYLFGTPLTQPNVMVIFLNFVLHTYYLG